MRDLWRQRYRWSYGTLQAMWKHRRAVRENGTAGHLGRRGILYLTFYTVLLPMMGPVVDVFAVYGILAVNAAHSVEIWLAVNLVTMLVGAYAFHLDGESPAPLFLIPLQQFVYRQLMYGVVLHAVKSAVLGTRVRWQLITRTGDFSTVPVDLTGTAPAASDTTPPATVTLGVAMPHPAAAATATTPVFVDDTRRRTRRAIQAGLVVAGLAAAAAFAVFASLAFRVSQETSLSQLPAASEQVTVAPPDVPAGVVSSAASLHAKSRPHSSPQAALGTAPPDDAPSRSTPTTRLAASRKLASVPTTAPAAAHPPTTPRKRSPTPTTRPARDRQPQGLNTG
jgi:hypothetical protein